MMNFFTVTLVLTSLVTGVVWFPHRHGNGERDLTLKGHRVVVVEFVKEDDGKANTKVFISNGADEKPSGSAAVGGAKEKASEVSGEAAGAKERAKEAFGEAKKTTKNRAQQLSDKVTEKAVGTKVGEALVNAKDKVKKVSEDVKEVLRDSAVKTASFDVIDSPKRMGEDIKRNVTIKVEENSENVMKQTEKIGEKGVEKVIKSVKMHVLSPETVDAVAGLVHMLGFSTAYGMCVWVTFFSSYILSRSLRRQQFGVIQSKMYPVYFRAMAYCVGAGVLGHLMSQRRELFSEMIEIFHGFCLVFAFLMVLVNLSLLEPRATKLMLERMKIEKEDMGVGFDDGEMERRNIYVKGMNEKLKKLNAYSSALNVSTLIVLSWHMAYISRRLQATL